MKETTYISRRICICRKCGGTGKYTYYRKRDVMRLHPIEAVCPQCGGSGRVTVEGTVTKTVLPYPNPDNDNDERTEPVSAPEGGGEDALLHD